MVVTRPSFYEKFKCIAEKCSDNCCIGWEVVVDRDSIEKYSALDTAFGKTIIGKITKDEDSQHSFKLDENKRCPFLNENNLCDIIKKCGEDMLCFICKEHPRFYNDFAESAECGLGLCCEEVCRLLLEESELEFVTEIVHENEFNINFCLDEDLYEPYIELFGLRKKMFSVLSGNEAYDKKIKAIAELTEKHINEKIVFDSDGAILARYEETEPINEEWTKYFFELKKNISTYLQKEKPFDETTNGNAIYSRILSYIIFRHLSSSVYGDNAGLKEYLNFCVSAVRFIKLCDIKTFSEKGALTIGDRIQNIKRWSKQIEYSDLNVDLLTFDE